MSYQQATSLQYPLRPGEPTACAFVRMRWTDSRTEFIESTWYLYRVSLVIWFDASLNSGQATRDPMYLDIGEQVFTDLLIRARVECGIAGVQDLRNNALEDRMESFVLSETLKVRNQPHVFVYSQIIDLKFLVSLFIVR
jgi:mannosidase alpha-like ER degradation enhancer 1